MVIIIPYGGKFWRYRNFANCLLNYLWRTVVGVCPMQLSSGAAWPVYILRTYSYYTRWFNCECEMTAYMFCIDSVIWGYREYQSIWDNPLADGDLLCEWEMGNSHNPQVMAIKRWSMVPQLQVVGHVPKKYLPINLFDIHVRLHRRVKIWMMKIWQIFGQLSISPNFSGTKISLHTVCVASIPSQLRWLHFIVFSSSVILLYDKCKRTYNSKIPRGTYRIASNYGPGIYFFPATFHLSH